MSFVSSLPEEILFCFMAFSPVIVVSDRFPHILRKYGFILLARMWWRNIHKSVFRMHISLTIWGIKLKKEMAFAVHLSHALKGKETKALL